jgi:hypothetical protein
MSSPGTAGLFGVIGEFATEAQHNAVPMAVMMTVADELALAV